MEWCHANKCQGKWNASAQSIIERLEGGLSQREVANKKIRKIKGPDNPTCVFFRKSVAVDTIGSLSKGTSECASVSQ